MMRDTNNLGFIYLLMGIKACVNFENLVSS